MCLVLDRVASEGLRSHNYCLSGSLPKLISNVRGCMLVCCLFAPLFYCFTVFPFFFLLFKLHCWQCFYYGCHACLSKALYMCVSGFFFVVVVVGFAVLVALR